MSVIAIGVGKIVAVLALDAHHHHLTETAPGLQQVQCNSGIGGRVWTGDTLAELLKRLIAVMGRPAAYLKDGGSDLHKASLIGCAGLTSPSIDDISHAVATMLKRRIKLTPSSRPLWRVWRVSGKLKHTMLACLAPPPSTPKRGL